MKHPSFFTAALIGMACTGLLMPTPLLRAANNVPEQERPQAPVMDVALAEGGVLHGQVVTSQGAPLGHTSISIRQTQSEAATTKTDHSGRFELTGLRGGTCQIVAGTEARVYRLWSPNTAPPSAKPSVLIVANAPQVLGQQGPIANWALSHPWLVGGLVAGAIATPIAIHNHQLDREPASP